MRRAWAVVFAAIPVAALVGGLPFANRLEPAVLGMPFLLAWILAWVALTPAFLAVSYVLLTREPEGSRHNGQVWGEASASPPAHDGQVWGEASASPPAHDGQVWGEASASPPAHDGQVWGEASASPPAHDGQVWGEASASPPAHDGQVWGEASASPRKPRRPREGRREGDQ